MFFWYKIITRGAVSCQYELNHINALERCYIRTNWHQLAPIQRLGYTVRPKARSTWSASLFSIVVELANHSWIGYESAQKQFLKSSGAASLVPNGPNFSFIDFEFGPYHLEGLSTKYIWALDRILSSWLSHSLRRCTCYDIDEYTLDVNEFIN